MERQRPDGRPQVSLDQSTNKREGYFNSLRETFEAAGGEAMDQATRARLLIGTNQHRGIFANPNKVYQSGDKDKITRQLVQQIHAHIPMNTEGAEDEYTQLKRALWTVGEQLGLGPLQKQQVMDALDKNFTNKSSKEPPETAAATRPKPAATSNSSSASSASSADFEAYYDELNDPGMRRYVAPDMRSVATSDGRGKRTGTRTLTDNEFREAVHAIYVISTDEYKSQHPEATDAIVHQNAMRATDDYINTEFGKIAPIGGMAKRLQERLPPIGAIAGAAGRSAPARGAPGGARSSIGGDLRAAARPGNVLRQVGQYGLSQAGWDVVNSLMSHITPASSLVARGVKMGLGTLANLAGGTYGGPIGQRAGRILGDTSQPEQQSLGESATRNLAGSGAQYVYNSFGNSPVKAAASGLWGRISGIAGRAAAGAAEGAETGAEAGTLAEPGGGTLVGGAIGSVAGLLTGAIAGGVTDEGAGILYRHLSTYGSHVPKMAASKLGYSGTPPTSSAVSAPAKPPPISGAAA